MLFKAAGLRPGGKGYQVHILEHPAVPPGNQGGVPAVACSRINPGPVLGHSGGLQLIEQRQFEAVGQVALPLELAEKFFDDIARDNHQHNRLQVLIGVREHLNAPDNLRHRHRRKFFQLQLDHCEGLVEIAARKLGYAKKNLLGRQPGDVKFPLPK